MAAIRRSTGAATGIVGYYRQYAPYSRFKWLIPGLRAKRLPISLVAVKATRCTVDYQTEASIIQSLPAILKSVNGTYVGSMLIDTTPRE